MKEVKILVHSKFKWFCIQPYGEAMLSVNRPEISNNGDYDENDKLVEFWEVDGDYTEIPCVEEYCANWKETLKRI